MNHTMKRSSVFLATLLSISFIALPLLTQAEEPNPYQSGMAFMRSGRYEQAAVELEKAKKITPGNTGVLYQLGMAYYNQERFDKAIALWTKASKPLDEKNMMKTTLLDIIERAKARKTIVEKIRRVEELERKGKTIPVDKGLEVAELYQKEKKNDKSLGLYNKLIETYPNDARPYAKVASLHYNDGRILMAERYCLLALERDKANADCVKLIDGINEEVEALRKYGYAEMVKGAHK
ncbi:MAG: tetratricopeptide repeat protein [Deltaproteobacteria bacterium]|nr:tetratricopeptide repeat protein [Deltaproteobacteria bacterium]